MAGKMTLYKLVMFGDAGVGREALINQVSVSSPQRLRKLTLLELCLGHFVETYDPIIEDSFRKSVAVDGKACMLEVLDTGGREEYTALRDQWIQDGEGFLLVYSITSRSSFTRVKRFCDQIRRVKGKGILSCSEAGLPIASTTGSHSPDIPIMLIGNNCDRVAEREVSTQEGHTLARELGVQFVESSAKNCINIERPFFDIVRILRRQRLEAGIITPDQTKQDRPKSKMSVWRPGRSLLDTIQGFLSYKAK
jgi:GTPase KRas